MRIQFRKGALQEYKDGYEYYQSISPKLGLDFEAEFWNAIGLLRENPLHYQPRYRDIRIVFFKRFPFGIHYLLKNEQEIIIFRILHTSRFFK